MAFQVFLLSELFIYRRVSSGMNHRGLKALTDSLGEIFAKVSSRISNRSASCIKKLLSTPHVLRRFPTKRIYSKTFPCSTRLPLQFILWDLAVGVLPPPPLLLQHRSRSSALAHTPARERLLPCWASVAGIITADVITSSQEYDCAPHKDARAFMADYQSLQWFKASSLRELSWVCREGFARGEITVTY